LQKRMWKCSKPLQNIKLTKCSGITPAHQNDCASESIEYARMIGCMNETSIGTAAIAQLASCGFYGLMDGPLLRGRRCRPPA
jgi:L-alanine-DL-glutamate epimerase-like enolase superfamily enzyme